MNNINSSADATIATARAQLDQANAAAAQARDWCLRANTANWESPAASVFSRWLAELALTAHRTVDQAADLRSRSTNV